MADRQYINRIRDSERGFSLLKRTQDPDEADAVLRPERLAKGFARPFEDFVRFAAGLGIPAPLLHGEPNYLAGVRTLPDIRFVCLNSAWFCRDSKTDRGQLWLGLPQLESLLPFDRDQYDKPPVAVAVLHHPPDWFANSECNAYNNRPNTYAYLAERSHVILSGHTHGAIERANRYYDRALLCLSGAAYDSHYYRNNFSILRIDSGVIDRRAWELDPRKPEWEEKKQRYPLRAERLGRGTQSPAKYLAWLLDQTHLIDLHQLKVEAGKTPPAAIDSLYIRLTSAASALKGKRWKRRCKAESW